MILALLALLTARGDDDATYERLFGPESTTATAIPESEDFPSPWRIFGPLVLGVGGLVLAWRMRRPPPSASEARPIVVIGRQPLGDRSALVLVEVAEPDGELRRLLIGTGPSAPTLVADLGSRLPPNVIEEVLAEREASSDARRAVPAADASLPLPISPAPVAGLATSPGAPGKPAA